ncbi:hypothetical protein SAMD00019534_084170 [Acytostelium subglobosum LB1]|uniref:hypothetical protein n=1 Tax=Acytostelium subglobosum LB1 TaxID=1410327 RepID=UPI000644EA31|nr:hypothetical protein SAMD00019534_084170 [Acytostelium subglobosum LB1]GAM25242.1 hypothetical protein SAMD00019534_084170 [Acytostelium subglobosum LB1]|eukprot:XP_012751762.1 hypothetical protein SAMD00019534_084170 [Acytostelium subglobosum LB1]
MTEPSMDIINTYSNTTIPGSLAELMDNHGKLQQISAYCKSAYGGAEAAQIYDQTQNYAKNALLNVAYHIQTIGSHLTTLLQLQANEVDKLEIQIKHLNQRVDMIYETTGVDVFKNESATKAYKSTTKQRLIESEDIRAPPKFVRKQVSYSIGTDSPVMNASHNTPSPAQQTPLSSNPSTPNQTSTPYQSPGYHTPPSIPTSKRPTMMAPGPAPALSVPSIPSRPPMMNGRSPSVTTPPLHSSITSSQDLPPPPSASFDLPPPPPAMYDLPPPPPAMYDLPPPPPQ